MFCPFDVLVRHATHAFKLEDDKFSYFRVCRILDSKSVWAFFPQSVYRDCFLGDTRVAFSLFCRGEIVMACLCCGRVLQELH